MSNKIKVKKRDGLLEDFDQMKIARVVIAAGLTHEEGQQLAAKITNWAQTYSNSSITSLQIRDKVIEELRKLNPNAANLYAWYEKTKDEPAKQKGRKDIYDELKNQRPTKSNGKAFVGPKPYRVYERILKGLRFW